MPVYISAAGLKDYARRARRFLAALRAASPGQTPDSLVQPSVFPGTHFSVDGQDVDFVPDLAGDVWAPSNSYVWIPSLRAAMAGALVFNGVHMWLANSTATSRRRWLASLDQLEARHAAVVVAGHKRSSSLADTPEVIGACRTYLEEFDRNVALATSSDDLIARMRARFPDLALSGTILARAARAAIPD